MSKLYELKEKIKADETDLKILKILAEDPKIKISEISRILNLPRERINYRIKRMIKLGLIQGFGSIVNFPVTNYRFYVIAGKIRNAERLKDIVNKIDKILKTHVGIGDFSFVLEFYSRDLKEAKGIYDKIKDFIKDDEIFEVKVIRRYLHLNPKDFDIYQWLEEPREKYNIREYEDLIKVLTDNVRTPYLKLKEKFGNVKQKVNFLLKSKILIPYAILNTSLLGYKSYFLLLDSKGFEIVNTYSLIIYELTFKYDYLCVLDLKSEKEFQEIQEKLEEIGSKFKFMIETMEFKYKDF